MAANRLGDLANRTEVLGIPVHSVATDDIPQVVDSLLVEERVSQIMLLRWWDFIRVRTNGELRTCASSASLCLPVSKSIVAGANLLRKQRPQRHLPFDFTIRLLGALEDKNRSIYILGGSTAGLRTVEQNLRETFPGLRFVGRYTGFYNRSMEADIITAIRKAGPDCILLGNGIAAGEKWISRHRQELSPCIALYSPETFDIFAERRNRTSRTAFRRGLDFLPEFFRHPWRILRFPVYLGYLLALLVARIFRR